MHSPLALSMHSLRAHTEVSLRSTPNKEAALLLQKRPCGPTTYRIPFHLERATSTALHQYGAQMSIQLLLSLSVFMSCSHRQQHAAWGCCAQARSCLQYCTCTCLVDSVLPSPVSGSQALPRTLSPCPPAVASAPPPASCPPPPPPSPSCPPCRTDDA